MDFELIDSVMVHRLVAGSPVITLFYVTNLTAFLSIAGALIFRFNLNPLSLTRLPFCLAIFICLGYQLPLSLFAAQVEQSIVHHWEYSAIVNGMSLFLLIWVFLTRNMDPCQGVQSYPKINNRIQLVVGCIGAILMWQYISSVPWECTGLYALLYDPPYTLLARELGVKLVGTSVATYSLGAYSGAVCPIFLMLSVWKVEENLSQFRFAMAFLFALIGFFAVAALLVTGIKGLLMPSALMLTVVVFYYKKTWTSRLLSIVLAMFFFLMAVSTFEFVKERGAYVSNGKYDFAACSVKMGTCEGSMSLVESMKGQIVPLGLSKANVDVMKTRLTCLCEDKDTNSCSNGGLLGLQLDAQASSAKLEFTGKYIAQKSLETESVGNFGGGDSIAASSSAQNQTIAGVSPLIMMGLPDRMVTFMHALLYRMFVVPFQVSVWHYMYAETEAVEGVETLPFARRLLGSSLNMPELVYQKYGSAYWGGDRTNTSSAPTSFMLAYPAYLGLTGFILAIFCILVLDFVLILLARNMNREVLPILIGLIAIMSVNFLMSDFVTVLLSHGGFAGIVLLTIYAIVSKRA